MANNRVEAMMTRARVILASLLPVFWLIASMDCLSDVVSGFPRERSDSTLSDTGHARDDCSPFFGSLEQSARPWSRRFNLQSGADGLSPPVVLSQFQVPIPDLLVLFSDLASGSPGLANCWQFRC